jgi:hypothetical protein
MRKILVPALFLALSIACFAQDSGEEAIILNQEMDFLRADAENPQVFLPQTAINTTTTPESSAQDRMDLERFFFGGEDRIQTKAAGPRRRAAED